MNTKIIKYELVFLLVISTVATYVYLKGESIPDTYLAISSNELPSLFSYYWNSLLTGMNYYTGFWCLFCFASLLPLYSLVFSKRNFLLDSIQIIPVSIFFIILFYFIKPSFLGGGIYQLLSSNLSTFTSVIVLIFSFVSILFIVVRDEFSSYVMKLLSFRPKMQQIEFNKVNELLKLGISKAEHGVSLLVNKKIEKEYSQEVPSIEKEYSQEVPSNEIKTSENLNINQVITAPNLIKETITQDETESFTNENVLESALLGSELVEVDTEVNHFSLPENRVSDEVYFDLVNIASNKKSEQRFSHPDDKYFQDIISKIHSKLAEFKIEGKIINVLKGPVVDTFEWELGTGEKISKLTSAAEDLSLALLGAPIRMVYPMKGRGTVGIEVPRNPREIIFLDEIIGSKEYLASNHQLPLAMGKDAFGEPVVVDLASMPHMLVAGATGAGKSVFINSILVSLLIKKSPAQMKLILIDPKQLELALYAKLPHLIMPVITDAKTASVSLLWATQEMERRYSIMTQFGVRNIEGFNHKLKRADDTLINNIRKFYEYETDTNYELPYIVIIVDEFADLILTASGKDIENNICRLAAKARAAGIHLVIATQRPSVDVITGLIKSNFPTRVSFRVTSAVDSRTILNSMGAEKLLGKGDMLYKYGVDTTRIHSSYVEEEDIESLTEKLADIQPRFNEHVMDFLANGGEEPGEIITTASKDIEGNGKDEKYDEAVRVVIEHRSASASLLQRRLGVGYNRAANLIEEMEANGVVGPAQGSKPRKVLLGSEGVS